MAFKDYLPWNISAKKAVAVNNTQILSNISTTIFPHWESYRDIAAFCLFDDIFSIVDKIAKNAATIPFYLYDKDGRDVDNKLSEFLANLTTEEKKLLYIYYLLSGIVYILPDRLEFGPNAGVKSFHFLNPGQTAVNVSEGFPRQIVGYKYQDQYTGKTYRFTPEEIIRIVDMHPSSDYTREFTGISRIGIAGRRLTRVGATMEITTAQLQNGGNNTIIAEKGMSVENMGARKNDWSAFTANNGNSGAPYWMDGEIGVYMLGLKLTDMEVMELSRLDFDKLCNIFGVSSLLFNNHDGAKFDNYGIAQRDMFTNACLPMVTNVRDSLNKQLKPMFPGNDTNRISEDISEIKVLQEDRKTIAEAAAAAPTFVPNELREQMGMPRLEDPKMDMVYIKNGYSPIDDMSGEIDLIGDE